MTPYEKNFKVPGRFEDHECTFITWPCKDSDLEIFNYENEIVIFAEKLSKFEKVVVWASKQTLDCIPCRPWLLKRTETILERNFLHRALWQWRHLGKLAKKGK